MCPPKPGTVANEAKLLSAASKLKMLRSLRLDLSLDTTGCPLKAVRTHATSPTCLKALTALTSLRLRLADCYEPAGDSWRRQQEDGVQLEAWEEVREVQRTSLLSALRAMPQLQHLDCRTLWLRPSEAASLTALTSLTLGGLLPLQEGMAAGAAAAASGALPPQLRTFTLAGGTSPTVLAGLQPPTCLTQLKVSCIRFGMTDVSPECRVLPDVVRDVTPAAELLARLRDRPWFPGMVIAADCGNIPMEPREDPGQGHVEWIGGLEPLGTRLGDLTLKGVRLRVGDLVSLVSTLPQLRVSTLKALAEHVSSCMLCTR